MSDLTSTQIFESALPEKLASDPAASSANAVFQFNITGDDEGTWTVDLTKDSDWVSAGASDDAACKITIAGKDFVDLWTGKLKGAQAFMMGKLKVEGNMGLAMKLQSFLG